MARDIMSIPITTMGFESCYSTRGRILTKWRASLKPENAKALVTSCSWFGYKIDGSKFANLLFFGYFICMLYLIIRTLISLANIWWFRWGWSRAQWCLYSICKITLNVNEEVEENGKGRGRGGVGIRWSNGTWWL